MNKRDIPNLDQVNWQEPAAVIQAYCELQGFVNEKVTQFREPSDGFCEMCPSQTHEDWSFHGGKVAYEFIVEAVTKALEAQKPHFVSMVVEVKAFGREDAIAKAEQELQRSGDITDFVTVVDAP